MALGTGGAPQRLGMTITTRGAAVINTAASFIRNTGMRTVIRREPIIGGVTLGAVQTKQAGMEGRIPVTAGTRRRQPGELT